MKFLEFHKLITEKDDKPGARFHSVQNREGPAGIVSGPIGKSDNFELRQNLDRWEYNPESDTTVGKSGFSTESKLWKSMLTSFRLLFNDPYFDKQVQKISKKFNDSRDSYKNIRGNEDGGFDKYDEENQLEKLERNQTKYRSDLTGFRDDLDAKTKILNRTKLPPSEKNKMETDIAMMEAKVASLNAQMKRESTERRKADYMAKINELVALLDKKRTRYDQAMLKGPEIEKLKVNIFDLDKKIEKYEEKLEKTTEELETLYSRINTINDTNEKANEAATTGFLDLIKFTASGLINEYKDKITAGDPSNVDWSSELKTLQDAVDRLSALESDASASNPILGYLEKFQRDYGDKEFNAGQALDKNVNITKARDFNKLPFMVLMRVYSSIRSSEKTPIALDKLTTVQNDASLGELNGVLDRMSVDTPEAKAEWENPNTKAYIKGVLDQLPIPAFSKNTFKARIDSPWAVNRGKKTPAALLKMNITDELKMKSESFDNMFSNMITLLEFDEDDYKVDMIEVLTR